MGVRLPLMRPVYETRLHTGELRCAPCRITTRYSIPNFIAAGRSCTMYSVAAPSCSLSSRLARTYAYIIVSYPMVMTCVCYYISLCKLRRASVGGIVGMLIPCSLPEIERLAARHIREGTGALFVFNKRTESRFLGATVCAAGVAHLEVVLSLWFNLDHKSRRWILGRNTISTTYNRRSNR